MSNNIIVISGSPKKNGNTDTLVRWFREGAESEGSKVKVFRIADIKGRIAGCMSCRACQKRKAYECVIKDEVTKILKVIVRSDAIVMATPLYFFSASAQLKVIFDRMFSLYKWDNQAGTMTTPLKGKIFALIASAYENIGLKDLERPFALTADYTGMKFASLLIPNAGESGHLKNSSRVRDKAFLFGVRLSRQCRPS